MGRGEVAWLATEGRPRAALGAAGVRVVVGTGGMARDGESIESQSLRLTLIAQRACEPQRSSLKRQFHRCCVSMMVDRMQSQ